MFKKIIITIMLSLLLVTTLIAGPLFSVDKQKGGLVPCLVAIFDTRSAYVVNEKKVNIELLDLVKVITNTIIPVPVIQLYYMYTGFKNDGVFGCCLGSYGGQYSVTSLTKYKTRTKEKFSCLIIPGFQMAFEIFGGKTWTEVVKAEKLKK